MVGRSQNQIQRVTESSRVFHQLNCKFELQFAMICLVLRLVQDVPQHIGSIKFCNSYHFKFRWIGIESKNVLKSYTIIKRLLIYLIL